MSWLDRLCEAKRRDLEHDKKMANSPSGYDPQTGSWENQVSLTGGTLPTFAQFSEAFDTVCADSDNRFRFSNDPFVGNDKLTCAQLWDTLQEVWDNCKEDGSDKQAWEEAYSWCSSVLGTLGWEWV